MMDPVSKNSRKRDISIVSNTARLPLKEANRNVPSPSLKRAKLGKQNDQVNISHASKPTLEHVSNTSQQVSKSSRLAGLDLYNWQQSWKRIMRESIVYFEGVEEHNSSQHNEYKKAAKALKQAGCAITPFYDSVVTIIISRRPFNPNKQYPPNDIFSNAANLKTKVWDYDKVFRFLKNLGILDHNGSSMKDAVAPNDSNLYNLLKEEKIFGAADRDPNAKRDDFHYFDKNYLYVYDLSQKVRPIAIREWGDLSYPVMKLTLDGKCPFIPEHADNSERKKARRAVKFEATESYRELLRRASIDILNGFKQGNRASHQHSDSSISTDKEDDSSCLSTTSEHNGYEGNDTGKGIAQNMKPNASQPRKADGLALKEPVLLQRNSSCIQPSNARYFDVAASGYNGASNALNLSVDSTLNSNAVQGNGLGPTMSQVPSKNIDNLKRRIIIKKQKQRGYETEKEKDLKPGYCENCRIKYDNFDDHVLSNRHRNFACDDRNFKAIDNLILTLKESQSLGSVISNGEYRST